MARWSTLKAGRFRFSKPEPSCRFSRGGERSESSNERPAHSSTPCSVIQSKPMWNGSPLPQCPAVAPSADGVAIGGNIRPPKRTVNVPPVYPATLSGSGRSGVVELDARIGIDGRISEVRVASGDPAFAASAVEAVRQWEWTPTLLNCQPVAIHATVHVNFAGAR